MLDDKDCIDCGLCELSCHNKNIECADVDFCKNSFESLSTQQCNAIACSYLNHIFEFAANTNRNKALQFDGYASTVNGKEAFVQIDQDNDSLESVRRLIGDFLLYSPADRRIQIGIVVLQELPKEGSRDVYNVFPPKSRISSAIKSAYDVGFLGSDLYRSSVSIPLLNFFNMYSTSGNKSAISVYSCFNISSLII